MSPRRALALGSALALALALPGCNVDVTSQQFNADRVDLTSVASVAWDVRVAFERADAIEHEQTLRVEPNGFTSLRDRLLEGGDYRLVAATSAHTAARNVTLNGHTPGVTITVAEGGTVAISLIG